MVQNANDFVKFYWFVNEVREKYPELSASDVADYYVVFGDDMDKFVEQYETKTGVFLAEGTFKSLSLLNVLCQSEKRMKDIWNDFVCSKDKFSSYDKYVYDKDDINDKAHFRNSIDDFSELPNGTLMWNKDGSELVSVNIRKLIIDNWTEMLSRIVAYPTDFDNFYGELIYPVLCDVNGLQKIMC